MPSSLPAHGALVNGSSTTFRAWAPKADALTLVLDDDARPMTAMGDGYFELDTEGAGPGTRYQFAPDGDGSCPERASR